jgi:hypothetical protein
MSTLSFKLKVNDVLTDATAVALSDPTGAFGVRRTDSGAVVVADATAMTHDGTGLYSYSFEDPAAGLVYEYWVEWVYGGETFRVQKFSQAAAADDSGSYLSVADARALAGTLPGFAGLLAKDDATLAALLALATVDIDVAMRYQGRKFDPSQQLEFPRVAYGDLSPSTVQSMELSPFPYLPGVGGGSVIWDWDNDANAAVVPQKVKIACLCQAAWLTSSQFAARLEAIRSGLAGQSIGTGSETYLKPADLAAMSGGVNLGQRAAQIMELYRLRSGVML